MFQKIESEIDELKKLDVIEPVSEATPWVSPLLAVPNGDVIRIALLILTDKRVPKAITFSEILKESQNDSILKRLTNVYLKIDCQKMLMFNLILR